MWLENLFEKIFNCIPTIMIMRPDEGGFRQTPKPDGGTWLKELEPGNWYFLWPIIMEHEVVKIKTQVKDVRIQSVYTSDGKNVCLGLTIRYYISNPIKAQLEVLDYDQSIQNISLGIVSDYIEEHTLEELTKSRKELKDKLLKSVRDEAGGWGLKIQSIKISDIGETNNLRLLMDDRIGMKLLD